MPFWSRRREDWEEDLRAQGERIARDRQELEALQRQHMDVTTDLKNVNQANGHVRRAKEAESTKLQKDIDAIVARVYQSEAWNMANASWFFENEWAMFVENRRSIASMKYMAGKYFFEFSDDPDFMASRDPTKDPSRHPPNPSQPGRLLTRALSTNDAEPSPSSSSATPGKDDKSIPKAHGSRQLARLINVLQYANEDSECLIRRYRHAEQLTQSSVNDSDRGSKKRRLQAAKVEYQRIRTHLQAILELCSECEGWLESKQNPSQAEFNTGCNLRIDADFIIRKCKGKLPKYFDRGSPPDWY